MRRSPSLSRPSSQTSSGLVSCTSVSESQPGSAGKSTSPSPSLSNPSGHWGTNSTSTVAKLPHPSHPIGTRSTFPRTSSSENATRESSSPKSVCARLTVTPRMGGSVPNSSWKTYPLNSQTTAPQLAIPKRPEKSKKMLVSSMSTAIGSTGDG